MVAISTRLTVADFASSLADRLGNEAKDSLLDSQLQSHITTLRTSGTVISSSRAADLDGAGTELWNTVIRKKRSNDQYNEKQLCLARVFAFYLIDSASAHNHKKPESCIRLLRLANKVVKSCLECEFAHLSWRLLERATDLDQFLEQHNASSKGIASEIQQMRIEYIQLRITHASTLL